MWIFLNNAFLSAVEHRVDPRLLLLRSRRREDLERVLPEGYTIEETAIADYRYRTVVSRFMLKRILFKAVNGITYTNFKGSVRENDRHDSYMEVWSAMHRFQFRGIRWPKRTFGSLSLDDDVMAGFPEPEESVPL